MPQPVSAQKKTYTLEAEFDQGSLVNTLHAQPTCAACFPDRDLVILGRTFVSQAGAVWVNNNPEGWIVGLDAKTGRQLVRLDSGLATINGLATGSAASGEKCTFWIGSGYSAVGNKGNCPGRITTDANGDVWIVNRGFNIRGTLSKFTTTKSHCIDRNNNGKIDSSADLDGNGIVDPDYVGPGGEREYLGAAEECILATVPVGAVNDLPRAVAVDKKGKIWVATFNGRKVYRYDPNEPLTLEATINLDDYPGAKKSPYSAATGKDYLFLSAKSSTVIRISIDAPFTVQVATCSGDTYGIVANPDGTEAWAGAHGNNGVQHVTFPPTGNGTCETWPSNGRTITAVTLDLTPAADGGPFIWGAAYGNGGYILKYNRKGEIVGEYLDGSNTHGISVDFQNRIWAVSHQSPFVRVHQNDGTLATAGNLAAFGFDMLPSTTAPGKHNYDPYLYSDFTGVQLDRQAPFTRVGTWSGITDGGAAGVPWKRVKWNEQPIGTQAGAEPEGTSLKLSARAADSLGELATAAFVTVPNGKTGADLSGIVGRYIEVRADLTGPGYETPVLSDVTVEGPCPGGATESCCLSDGDCSDGLACTLDSCPAPGAACVFEVKKDCCVTDAQCADTNLCTKDACDLVLNVCVHNKVPDCCSASEDCDDGDLCSADLCSGPGGKCSFKTIQGCCLQDTDCTKGNLCSNAKCPKPGALCLPSTQTGCCATDSDCKDSDQCTADKCDVAKKACSNDFIAGCCTTDAQCNDNDPCTVDKCTGNACAHDAKDGATCCTQTSPSVGEACDIPKAPNNFSPCKAGKKVCKADGTFSCEGAVLPSKETCDGVDNDCNGVTDDEDGAKPCDAPKAPNNFPPCAAGKKVCKPDGSFACTGAILPAAETCDGIDNNCDGVVDDNPTGCGQGFSCVKAQCVKPCAAGEFPCDPGFTCQAGFCVSQSGSGGSAGSGGAQAGGTAGKGGASPGGTGGKAGGPAAGAAGLGGSGGSVTAGAAGAAGGGGLAGSGGKAGSAASAGAAAAGTTGGGTGGRAGSAGSVASKGGAPGAPAAQEDKPNNFGLATGGGCHTNGGSPVDPRSAALALGVVALAASRRVRRSGKNA